MNAETQRIAIAEACGWKNVHQLIVKNVKFQGDDRICGITSDDGWVPDYLHDLNAMHEAEKVLRHDQMRTYGSRLIDTLGTIGCVYATAAQRSQAFLKTLGLWKEETQSDNQQKGTDEDKR